jgi:hypothetical protein
LSDFEFKCSLCSLTENCNIDLSHLTAFSRLPHTWTLLYSLDQHGISLNALYTRCELQGPVSAHLEGSIATKDSGDAVFGAWLGEGVWASKDSY